ncbi:hypothetical protein T06_16436 [Trichinella sp. T6]|nr:hypothetical protein T06_16436 [Trichinella sp. T6]
MDNIIVNVVKFYLQITNTTFVYPPPPLICYVNSIIATESKLCKC